MEQLRAFNIDYIPPLSSPDQGLILPGVLNHVLLLHDRQGNLYVQRTIKDDTAAVVESINREYEAIGFFNRGGSFVIRSLPQQTEFMQQCRNFGLHITVPVYSDEKTMYLPFIEGAPYHVYIAAKPKQLAETVRTYLRSITDAHSLGVVYGDRWGPNTIVDGEEQLWHIDFDIQLIGSPAREFEIAQAIYYSLYFAKDKEPALLECTEFIYSPSFGIYDLGLVLDFLKGHIRYFQNGNYGDIQTEISRIIHAA